MDMKVKSTNTGGRTGNSPKSVSKNQKQGGKKSATGKRFAGELYDVHTALRFYIEKSYWPTQQELSVYLAQKALDKQQNKQHDNRTSM